MSEHLDDAQLLDLDRVKSLGPLFEQARMHLADCPQCRRLRLEAEALRALALESSPELPRPLLRAALKAVRTSDVESRLKAGAGEDAAREILLAASRSSGERQSPALLYAALAAASLGALWWFSSRQARAPLPEPQTLPFEFQAGPETPMADEPQPALPEDEAKEERQLETEARRMVAEHLHATSVATSTPRPALAAAPTLQPPPTPARALPPSPLPTQAPAIVQPLASPALPGPTLPPAAPPSFRMENPRFRAGQGRALFKLYFPENSPLEIRVFDATGKSVKLLTEGKSGPGNLALQFEGLGEDGRPLLPGSYFARVMTRWFSRVETLELLP